MATEFILINSYFVDYNVHLISCDTKYFYVIPVFVLVEFTIKQLYTAMIILGTKILTFVIQQRNFMSIHLKECNKKYKRIMYQYL